MLLILKIFFVLLMINSCTLPPLPEPVEPEPIEPLPDTNVTCEGVCIRAEALGCKWSVPTPHGTTCKMMCEQIQNSGIILWDLECRSTAKTCREMDACER